MKQLIGSLLLPLSDALFAFVAAIPLWMVRTGVFLLLGLLAFWVIRMKPQLPDNTEDKRPFSLSDLRLFALGVLLLQAILYVIF